MASSSRRAAARTYSSSARRCHQSWPASGTKRNFWRREWSSRWRSDPMGSSAPSRWSSSSLRRAAAVGTRGSAAAAATGADLPRPTELLGGSCALTAQRATASSTAQMRVRTSSSCPASCRRTWERPAELGRTSTTLRSRWSSSSMRKGSLALPKLSPSSLLVPATAAGATGACTWAPSSPSTRSSRSASSRAKTWTKTSST
mmetsp:Transcript_37536/g.112076  ORF Transcript_37536/g.112076 Transcript_37536/m.112076 type:complete len:202 (+) Transcript_37536:199-804(+)